MAPIAEIAPHCPKCGHDARADFKTSIKQFWRCKSKGCGWLFWTRRV